MVMAEGCLFPLSWCVLKSGPAACRVRPVSILSPQPLRLAEGLALSESTFPELLFGALSVPDVSRGFLVRPALFPRFAQAARG
jgi:hypothetical protein